jgi:hypothetical protein
MKMMSKVKGFFVRSRIWADTRGFGMNEVLGIAAALIIAGFVIIPGFRTFTSNILADMTKWWNKTISDQIFRVS